MSVLLAGVLAYLVGGIPFSYIAGKLAQGIDLRQHGSGNLGASNTYRILGGRIALVVLGLDILKGLVPVVIASRFDIPGEEPWHAIAAAAGAVLGHLFSPYLKFSGGKGIATSAGAFLGLAPFAFMAAFTVFVVVFAVRRIVSLASLAAAVTLTIAAWIGPGFGLGYQHRSVQWVATLVMVVVILKHRSNIRRLRDGTEPVLARRKA
ncbi:MAG TPA: glycerol-3-phosphate 1-O-acyltransferase PlsY [Candidatus Krumholzibacteria bacterium]|nr:glycerol-3-phosphate 1-O-acyltransferase PlsY [Candidatus Krumholzibacteria bacterium]